MTFFTAAYDRVVHGGVVPYVVNQTVDGATKAFKFAEKTSLQTYEVAKRDAHTFNALVRAEYEKTLGGKKTADGHLGNSYIIEFEGQKLEVFLTSNPDYKTLSQRISKFSTDAAKAVFSVRTLAVVGVVALVTFPAASQTLHECVFVDQYGCALAVKDFGLSLANQLKAATIG